MLKFLLDENVPASVSSYLRETNHDIKEIREIKRGLSDTKVLEIAEKEERVLITLDKDFAKLFLLKPKSTIILTDIHPPLPERIIKVLKEILNHNELLQTPGLIVGSETTIRKIKIDDSFENK